MEIDPKKLEDLRDERALSQRELANLAGVSPNTVYLIRHGHTNALPRTVRKLADALGVSPREIRKED